jgi:hypothetical protein
VLGSARLRVVADIQKSNAPFALIYLFVLLR